MPANWPQLILEGGFATTSPVQPGGTFILDDSSNGKLDTNTLGGAVTWSDLSAFMRSGSTNRPAQRQQGPLWAFQQATASVILNNADGRFDPDNLSGPYVAAGATELNAMVPVRVSAVWNGIRYYLFTGYADSWADDGVNYANRYAEVTLSASDGQKVLNGITLSLSGSGVGSGEGTGARINRILNNAMWYTGTGQRVVATGNSTVQAYAGQAAGSTDTAWNLMQVTADSEIGELYIDGQGRLVFRNRQAILTDNRSIVRQAIFGDSPGTMHGATATSLANNFEGGTSGTTISTGNSGGISGQAFAAVSTSGGGTVTFSSAQAAHGALSAACVTTASTSTANMSYVTGSQAQLWARIYFYVPAAPAVNDYLIQFTDNSGTRLAAVGIAIDGSIGLYNAAGAGFATFITIPPAGSWVQVAVTVTFPGTSTAMIQALLYTSPDSSVATETLTRTGQNFGSTPVQNVLFGPSKSVASNFTVYLDDLDVNWTGWAGPASNPLLPELAFTALPRVRDDVTLGNDIQATRTGGSLQEVQDAASILTYLFPRTYQRSDLILQDDPTTLNWAQWVLYISKSNEDRFDQIIISPLRDPADLWPQALGREIGDRITVVRNPPGVGNPVVKDCFIRGIAHQWDWGAGTWQTTWTLQDATKYGSFFTLDNSILGKLDQNALTF